ncbi:hypothetical protein LUZ60_017759 [Juncus effusus]|nr:hypothetical protein LUZ60_017759 [Juncus effusus]
MHLSENEGIEGKTFAVTGGLGLVGSALCLELARRGADQVRSLDVRPPSSSPFSVELRKAGVRLIQGDVRKKKDVEKALRGAHCVFHLASYGSSGKQMLQAGRIDDTNINGTLNVLDACHESGVKRLVYLSSCNVVFGKNEISNGNETGRYFPIEENIDPFGRSKCIAEQLVLKSNGRHFKNKSGARLYTCSIRPGTIYGPGDETCLPRILSLAKSGLFLFNLRGKNVKTDWVYVDNLVLGLLLGSMGLLEGVTGREGRPVSAGQAYFITDGSPVNSFEFIINPLLKGLEYEPPKLTLDFKYALIISKIMWFLYTFLYPWLERDWLPNPPVLPPELYKIGVTHHFSILKAREELGYIPLINPKDGLSKTISYFQQKKIKELDGPTIFPWIFCILGMTLLFFAAFLPPNGPLHFNLAFHLFIFRSLFIIRVVFVVSVLLHLCEAIYALYLAKWVDPRNAKGWFWQTLALGFFSLRYLLKRARS